MKARTVSYSVERTINLGNYESVKIRAEIGAESDSPEKDLSKIKKELKAIIEKDSEQFVNSWGNE